MGKERAETTIDRPPDEVWARVGNFGDLSWNPDVESTVLDGDRRTTKIRGSGLLTVEQLQSRDDAGRTLTYATVDVIGDSLIQRPDGSVFDVASMVGHHRATITVTPESETRSRVTHEADVDDSDEMAVTVRARYQGVLDRLKAELEP